MSGRQSFGGVTGRASSLAGYRQVSVSPAPGARAWFMVGLVAISLVLIYTAERAARAGLDRSWLLAVALAALFVARGMHLNRPIFLPHLGAAMLVLAVGDVAYRADRPGTGFALVAASGLVLVLPQGSEPQPELHRRVAALIDRTAADPLAPFAMHSAKSYFFNAAGTAAIAYRSRLGIAVVSGDPIGERAEFGALIEDFVEFARQRGWRVAVLGAGAATAAVWNTKVATPLRAIPIGRDVVLDVPTFAMVGRKFRNLRQAVSRTKNFGVTTEVVEESALSEPLRAELYAIVDEWNTGRQTRGFSMILDHLLDGEIPGMLVVLARDADGRVAGFQRYGRANAGAELSLDVPWRRRDAPNGLDERMIVDLVDYARDHGVQRISLAFAAFPDLFADKERSVAGHVGYRLVHLLDPLIKLESLYRFLRKFHALDGERVVLLRLRYLIPVALACLTLEFAPRSSTVTRDVR
ncbi:MAG: DUF2156 domain-containing protein [Mycobacteriaceae bacterium]|nr:DUF2156 domain-containing protein [Mycobacteriaceae bacterium]